MGLALNFLSGRDEFSYIEKTVSTNEEEFIDSTYTFENKFSGFTCDIGLTTTILRKLSFGCVVSTPFTLKLVGITETIDGQTKDLGDTSLDIPMFMAIGAAYRPVNRLLVAMDFRWLSWSRIGIDSSFTAIELPFNDVNTFHLGLEYLFTSEEMTVPVRVGFHTDPRINSEFNPALTTEDAEQVRGIALSFGTGLSFSNIIFDLSIKYSFHKYKSKNFLQPEKESWDVDENSTNVLFSVLVKI